MLGPLPLRGRLTRATAARSPYLALLTTRRAQVVGTLPKELSGTLLRNGPGLFEVGDRRITMPFDGDGLVCSFAFRFCRAYFRSAYGRNAAPMTFGQLPPFVELTFFKQKSNLDVIGFWLILAD